MAKLRLLRAFLCFHAMGLIGFFAHYFPRTPRRNAIVNMLSAPFFKYGAYWALYSNPNFQAAIRKARATDNA